MGSDKKQKDGEDSISNLETSKKKRKDRRVEREYYDFIEVKDPISGQLTKQKVKITKYKTKSDRFKFQPAIEEEELGYQTLIIEEDEG